MRRKSKDGRKGRGKKKEMLIMNFSSVFSKAIAALLLFYEDAPTRSKSEDMDKYIRQFVENGDYIVDYVRGNYSILTDWEFWRESFKDQHPITIEWKNTERAAYLLTIFIFLFELKNDLQESELYELENLRMINSGLSVLNTFLSSLIMNYDFREFGRLDFASNYLPNNMSVKYSWNMYRTERMLRDIQEDTKGEGVVFDKDIRNINQKLDREVLTTGLVFMEIQAILVLMECSSFYAEQIRIIAKSILLVFKEILADARIERIEIDPSISSGIIRAGSKMTTGIKIFFALGNMDRYCLRIDFPHEGEDFLHYNLHEPGERTTALPLKWEQYNDLKVKYGNLDDLFFEYGKLYWFRSNFLRKLKKCAPSRKVLIDGEDGEFEEEIRQLFHEQGHYRMFNESITKMHMHEFIAEFGMALSYVDVLGVIYSNTDVDNINGELTKICLRDLLNLYIGAFQKCTIREQILEEDKSTIFSKLKKDLLNILFNGFKTSVSPYGTREEFDELELKDILLVLDDICF